MRISSIQAYIEKEDSKKLKQKQRERMQPKMGKMDIDYQVLFYLEYHMKFYHLQLLLNDCLCGFSRFYMMHFSSTKQSRS